MQFFRKFAAEIKNMNQKQKNTLVGITAALMVIAVVTFVESPPYISVSATSKQLPIYSVERDQRMVSLTFDAAWGDDFCGNAENDW